MHCILPYKDKKQQCKSYKRRTAVAEKGQWDTYYRQQSQHHTYINSKM